MNPEKTVSTIVIMERGIPRRELLAELGKVKAIELVCFKTDVMMPVAAVLMLKCAPKGGPGNRKSRVPDTALHGAWQFRDDETKAALYGKGVLRGGCLDPNYLELVTHTMGRWRGKGTEALPRSCGT